MNKLKIINDPVYGFITLPNTLVFDLIEHPWFQRLRYIRQLGMTHLVYPGALHTRFHHALGAMHLMANTLEELKAKGNPITDAECQGAIAAILLHDIGHGPFSHAMEHSIVEDVNHEAISLLFMNKLNTEFEGKLSLAIQIFKGEYHRKFMLQLISSQLDMDRMDYLKRDSFYSGVAEGNISSDRLIQMMTVIDDQLVIEEKGIYSVEKFLMARRLMYWQVYFHKTSLVAELILTKVLKRAKELTQKGIVLNCSESLLYFMNNKISLTSFNNETLDKFANLDDFDIISALKSWINNEDYILSNLSKMIINRDLLKIKLNSEKFSKADLESLQQTFSKENQISIQDSNYFIFKGKIKNQAYSVQAEPIRILKKDSTVEDVVEASDQLNLKSISKEVTKYYLCFPKQLIKS
jgi:HD superfamily phosphohydrolase